MAELAEAQRRSEERIGRLEMIVAELAEAQRRTEQALAALSEAMRILTQRVDRMDITVARLVGDTIERHYRERAATYLARVLQKVRVVTLDTIIDKLEKVLDDEESDDLLSRSTFCSTAGCVNWPNIPKSGWPVRLQVRSSATTSCGRADVRIC